MYGSSNIILGGTVVRMRVKLKMDTRIFREGDFRYPNQFLLAESEF